MSRPPRLVGEPLGCAAPWNPDPPSFHHTSARSPSVETCCPPSPLGGNGTQPLAFTQSPGAPDLALNVDSDVPGPRSADWIQDPSRTGANVSSDRRTSWRTESGAS